MMQGMMPFYGPLASLRLQMPPSAAASASQDMSDMAQANSGSLSGPLASITRRINTGSLEDRPSSSCEGAGQEPTGQFGAPLHDYRESPAEPTTHDLLSYFDFMQVLSGTPVADPGFEAAGSGMSRQEQQAQHRSSSLPIKRSTSSQPNTMPELLAQQSPYRSLSLQAPFSLTRQDSTLDPLRQQQRQQLLQQQFQQQPQFGLPAGFQTSLNSTGFMSSGRVPQLQAFPASQGLANQGLAREASFDTSSSTGGGKLSRHSGSRSLRSSPRSPVQTSGQFAFSSEAQHAGQQWHGQGQGQGQGLPVMPFRHATSLSPGAVGPIGRGPVSHSPSQSPSPRSVLASGHLLQQAYQPPSLWYPERSSQGGLGAPIQGVASPLVTHHPEGNPSYQPATGQGWDHSAVPHMLGAHPGSQRTSSVDSEPGVFPLRMAQ